MTVKRALMALTAVLVAALPAASPAAAASGSAAITIRYQMRGGHAWAVNGGAFKASQTVTLGVKGTLTITNDDMRPHTLLKLSGAAVRLSGAATMGHMAATLRVTFPRAGTYVFETKAGENYMPMKTIGEDNVLRLVVYVK